MKVLRRKLTKLPNKAYVEGYKPIKKYLNRFEKTAKWSRESIDRLPLHPMFTYTGLVCGLYWLSSGIKDLISILWDSLKPKEHYVIVMRSESTEEEHKQHG